jgi:hypothetical protein
VFTLFIVPAQLACPITCLSLSLLSISPWPSQSAQSTPIWSIVFVRLSRTHPNAVSPLLPNGESPLLDLDAEKKKMLCTGIHIFSGVSQSVCQGDNHEYYSCHRSSELLLSIPSHKRAAATAALDEPPAGSADESSSTFQTSTPAHSSIARHPRPSFDLAGITTPTLGPGSRQGQVGSSSRPSSSSPSEAELEHLEEDAFAAAKACFDAKEFTRTVRLLEECKSAKARFLRIYCQFLVRSSYHRGSFSLSLSLPGGRNIIADRRSGMLRVFELKILIDQRKEGPS